MDSANKTVIKSITQLNVDPGEIAKFEATAHRWWDTSGEFKTLHDINPLRLDFILQKCGGTINNLQALDVGCGGGILSESLCKAGATTKGIDLGAAPLSVAAMHAEENSLNIDYQKISVEAAADLERGQYDIVTCMEMLEHVPNPASVIKACAKLAKPGGNLFFSTLNRNLKSYALAIVGAEYLLKLLPRGTHDFEKFIKPSEMDHWIRAAGLTTKAMSGIVFNPLFGKFSLSSDTDVNYMIHAIKPE